MFSFQLYEMKGKMVVSISDRPHMTIELVGTFKEEVDGFMDIWNQANPARA